MWITDVGEGTLQLHAIIQGPITFTRIKHFRDVLDNLILDLIDRGMDHIDTWVEHDNENNVRFAEFFGFVDTGWLKIINIQGHEYVMQEMRLTFPNMED